MFLLIGLFCVSLFAVQTGASGLKVKHCSGTPIHRSEKGGLGYYYLPGNRVHVDQAIADLATGHGFIWNPSVKNYHMHVLVTSTKVRYDNGTGTVQYSLRASALHGKPRSVRLAWALDKLSEPLMTFTTVDGQKEACVEVNIGWHGLYLWVQTL